MIHNIVTSISDRLDEYVKNKLSLTEDAVIISSIVDIKGNVNQDIENKICVFLLNIEAVSYKHMTLPKNREV